MGWDGTKQKQAFCQGCAVGFCPASAYLVTAAYASFNFSPFAFIISVTTTVNTTTTSTLSTTTTLNTTSTTTSVTTTTFSTTSTTLTTTINPCNVTNSTIRGDGQGRGENKCTQPGEHEGHDSCCVPEDNETQRGIFGDQGNVLF